MKKAAPTLAGKGRPVVQALRKTPRTLVAPRGLRILRGTQAPADMALALEERYIIGRHDAADIGFASDEVSRVHGVLIADGEGWTYRDLGSRNGSVLLRGGHPGAAVSVRGDDAVSLSVGDTIELGGTTARLEFLYRREVPTPQASDPTGQSAAALAFFHQLRVAGYTRAPVFLLGASGSGKTHSARRVHDLSTCEGAFVPLNCARLPQDAAQLHSTLLGHTKGAFTGAVADRTGKLLRAHGGTLFLDEVESLSPMGQGFLLDVLEGSGDSAPLGATDVTLSPPLFRLISASKRPLSESGLRDDLCERLAEGHMWRVPSLTERRDDIPGLVAVFAEDVASQLGARVAVASSFVDAALDAPWDGEIRQLKAAVRVLAQVALAEASIAGVQVERAEVKLDADMLRRHLDERASAFGAAPGAAHRIDARTLTRAHVVDALRRHDNNRSAAARALGIARNTLIKKIKDYDLS